MEKLKTFEAEVTQLRGLTHEQQRSLRMATRATEQLQSNERTLNEEIERLRTSLEKERTHLATVQVYKFLNCLVGRCIYDKNIRESPGEINFLLFLSGNPQQRGRRKG